MSARGLTSTTLPVRGLRLPAALLGLSLCGSACAPSAPAAEPVQGTGPAATSGPGSGLADAQTTLAPNAESAPAGSATAGGPADQPSPPAPAGTQTLPALTVKNVGLHVGGGPNDSEFKAPLLQAIEQRFPELLRCYRLVNEPGAGGTFGVDLHIERAGGHPRTEQPRTALGDDAFKACMVAAFESVTFPAQKRATVISYSVRFSVE